MFQAHGATGHCGGLPARLHRAGRRAVSIAALKFDDFAPGRAGADPAPRGIGARGWRRICSPDLFLSPPRRNQHRFRRGFVFSKTEYWDQLPSLSSELKREDATARFLRRGFPYGFSRGIPCSAYTERYPIPASRTHHAKAAYAIRRNLKNAPENIVRMGPGKIATHYTTRSDRHGWPRPIRPRSDGFAQNDRSRSDTPACFGRTRAGLGRFAVERASAPLRTAPGRFR